jgi:hypothetical protein
MEKKREGARLINMRIFCLEEIRELAYPHFSFTRGRVKHKKATHPLPTITCLVFFRSGRVPYEKRKKTSASKNAYDFMGKCDQGRICPCPIGYTCKHFVC